MHYSSICKGAVHQAELLQLREVQAAWRGVLPEWSGVARAVETGFYMNKK